MVNNSDYTKPYMKLFDLLPEVYKSDVNKSLFSNLFDRYLTKQETEKVAGYIGEGNPNAVVSRQINETNVHRQAYQLQPILYNKVGSVEWMSSWKDILNQAERQGIDSELIKQWMTLLKFNWAPPIDIDKLIHYQDYYWYDENNVSSAPEYITIRSRCTTLNAIAAFHQRLVDEYGSQFNIENIESSGNNGTYDTLIINGDLVRLFTSGFIFNVVGSLSGGSPPESDFEGQWVTLESTYNSTLDETSIIIDTDISITELPIDYGNISLDEYLVQVIDEANNCVEDPVIPAANQWITTNKWLHKIEVPNFSIAKQAAVPIIEFDWDLELNEWTYTNYVWKYRSSSAVSFEIVNSNPEYIEYAAIENYNLYQSNQNQLELDDRYGDLTDYFTPGRQFSIASLSQLFEVESSEYLSASATEPKKTVITLTEDFIVPSGFNFGDVSLGTSSTYNSVNTPFQPLETSFGDIWRGQNEHWVLTSIQETMPVPHQPEDTPIITEVLGDVLSSLTFELPNTSITGSSATPRTIALVGTNTVAVYINGVRQYGTYIEETEYTLGISTDNMYVAGITFLSGYEPSESTDVVEIRIGEPTISDVGKSAVEVRTIEDDTEFANIGVELKTLIEYRKEEQVKTRRNQYPLFDLYSVDGTPAYKAEPIFKFAIDSGSSVNVAVGQRLKLDGALNYVFEQSLVEEDNGKLYAYRDYSLQQDEIWINLNTNTVYFWANTCWTDKIDINNVLLSVFADNVAPLNPIEGDYWLDTFENKLKIYMLEPPHTSETEHMGPSWVDVSALYQFNDPTLQTIWKKGLNDETYIPVKRDEKKRTEEDFNEQKELYIQTRVNELVDSGVDLVDAEVQALSDWNIKETTQLSQFDVDGNIIWYGDWELPDPLYYNNSHENRKEVSMSEVVTHFSTIIDSQEKLPGYDGTLKSMFHLIPINSVNFGLGGKIREYKYGFDTFLSSLFVNEVSPSSLINFAHDQYEILINTLKEIYRSNAVDLLSDVSDDSIQNQSSFISSYVIDSLEKNDQLSQVYGDSTTFIDNSGTNDIGIRNWIATLPFLCLVEKRIPHRITDTDRNLNHIVHHDGHREDYFLATATAESIAYGLTQVDDARVPGNKLGIKSTSLPPNDAIEFETQYGTVINERNGVYWYYSNGTTRTLYRLSPLSIGVEPPSDDSPDGSTWLDLTPGSEVLRYKITNDLGDVEWVIPAGIESGSPNLIKLHNGTGDVTSATVSAWNEIDVNELLRDVIFEAETRLYEVAPECNILKYDYSALETQYPSLYNQYLEEQYLAFIREREIVVPYSNVLYDATNAFTWNYKYSTIGQGYAIVDIDIANNAFIIEGDYTSIFTSSFSPLYIKNGGVNDGTWEIISSSSYLVDDVTFTKIFVAATVYDTVGGVIYAGDLPSSLNDGSESGGDWKDLYNKFYGTPFPHLEPWKLQGYIDKPSWWDDEYLNDDPLKWGIRRWKYKHGFAILSSSSSANTFNVRGDFTELFVSGLNFSVDGGSPHDGNWIVNSSIYDVLTNETTIYLTGNVDDNTIDEGRIALRYGMWDMIMRGIIPPNTIYPNGLPGVTGSYYTDFGTQSPIPLYFYISVNIGNDTINYAGEYMSDEIFPPYWNYTGEFGTSIIITDFDGCIRSLFWQISIEIVSPSADYVFGDAGPYEWLWRESSQYLYDQMVIAFKLDPIKFIYSVFGSDYYEINGLLVDSRTEQILTHTDMDFHGDFVDGQLFKVNGINQWYVNYLRYLDYDISMSDFRTMWSDWTTPMMYQFSSFIDTPSLDVGHRQVCISDFDYRIASKKSAGVDDYWLDSFNIGIVSAPPKFARQDNEYAWKLTLTTKTSVTNGIQYYDIQNYQFYADPDTDLCTLFSWKVSNISFFNNTFTIHKDQTDLFLYGKIFQLVESSNPLFNATYTVESSVYDSVYDITIIQVQEALPSIPGNDGRIILDDRKLPWQTGENVTLTTHGFLPTPLQTDNVNGVYQYFVIVESDNTFRLANTAVEANSGLYIDITSSTQNDLYVGKIRSVFKDNVQPVNWRHYVLDIDTVRTFTPPYEFSGLQTLINIVDGYEAYTQNIGWKYNADNTLRDPVNTAYSVNWQYELIRFLDFAYNVRLNKTSVDNRYPVEVDETTNIWTLTDNGQPQIITGDPVTVFSINQVYPTPLVHGGRYYMIRDSLTEFRLAATKTDAMNGIEIDIIDISGTRELYIALAKSLNVVSTMFEINPFRNSIWFRPSRGIVSNLLKGPTNSSTSHILVDQYGRAIKDNAIRVYREDKETKIEVIDGILNDIELSKVYSNPYNYIHLGAAHIFVDTYEHVLIFNDETTEGQLLYDSFLGLNLTKFEMLFNRQSEFTQRPNVGGQYLSTYYNQGAFLKRNIEASVEDLRYLYDTFRVIEANDLITQGRKSIGYNNEETYFDNMNITDKSKFVFWRGQIQHKGAMTSIQAFINSRRFIDATVDEYWAVKVADFGSVLEKEYVEMWLNTDDVGNDDIFLQFQSGTNDICVAGYDTNPFDNECGYDYPITGQSVISSDGYWIGIHTLDKVRWYNYPNQQEDLANNAGTIYFDIVPTNRISITINESAPSNPNNNDGWIKPSATEFRRWDAEINEWVFHGSWSATTPILRHDMKSDYMTVTAKVEPVSWTSGSPELMANGYYDVLPADIDTDGKTITIPEYVLETRMIKVFRGTGTGETFSGVELVKGEGFAEEVQNNFLSNKIYLTNVLGSVGSPVETETVRVVYGSCTFTQDVHYELLNTNIISFNFVEMASDSVATISDLVLWGWNFDKNALNPHSIIDVKSDTLVTRMTVWDPARGWNYYLADHVIDLRGNTDIAFYSESAVSDVNQLAKLSPKTAEKYWGSSRVGTTFMNTKHLDYVPYYDPAVITKVEDRLSVWGKLSDWAELKVYEWVESDVPPSEWNDIAVVEELDLAIPQQLRKAGRTFKTTFIDDSGEWKIAENIHDTFDPVINDVSFVTNDTDFQFLVNIEQPLYSTVHVFVNGQEYPETHWNIIGSPATLEILGITQQSRVELVYFVPGNDPTLDDATNIANLDTAIASGTYMSDYQYTKEKYIDSLGQEKYHYYFWVEDKPTKGKHIMSPQSAQDTMVNFPIPYVVYQYISAGEYVTYDDNLVYLPPRFKRAVLRGLRSIIDDNDRYVVRWTRDYTLRDELLRDSLAKKEIHEEWDLIRREMPYHIPRWLWDKLTESMIGYLLTDSTIRVPSYERELYDTEYESDTQYGIGNGQTFADGVLIKETVTNYLNNSGNDFSPIDINVFFNQNTFDTNDGIIQAMDTIYNNFPYLHVNAIFFDALLDSFSKKTKYEGIFKTSMIAVHCIQPIEISGWYDD